MCKTHKCTVFAGDLQGHRKINHCGWESLEFLFQHCMLYRPRLLWTDIYLCPRNASPPAQPCRGNGWALCKLPPPPPPPPPPRSKRFFALEKSQKATQKSGVQEAFKWYPVYTLYLYGPDNRYTQANDNYKRLFALYRSWIGQYGDRDRARLTYSYISTISYTPT